MPSSKEAFNKPKTGLALLLGVLIACSASLMLNHLRPNITYAVAPTASKQSQDADAAQAAQAKGFAAEKADKLAITPSIWPVNGSVTSGFGSRNSPFGDGNELHPGLDIAVGMGFPVVATADGKVLQSGPVGGYGNLVQIDHGNGIATLYGHNSQLAVRVGQSVKKGQVIAYAGSTGKSTGPHVHYEVRENDTAVDPWTYLISSKKPV